MTWESATKIATKVQLRTFGSDIEIEFDDGNKKSVKSIINMHMNEHKSYHTESEDYLLMCSVAQEEIKNVQSVISIFYKNKTYGILKYQTDPDGYFVFFLSE